MSKKSLNGLNIFQKVALIRKQVEFLKKDKEAYGYWYTKEETILAKITALMGAYGLSLIPGVVPGTISVQPYHYVKTKVTKKGDVYEEQVNEILVSADTTWTWVNNENPEEKIVVPWAMVGQQNDASQAFGSGLTYSSRYFLLKFFNISTSEDDPDEFRARQKEAELAADKIIAQEIIEVFDELARTHLEKNPDDKTKVKELVERHVKDGNYYKINDSKKAAKLLGDFKETFNIKEEE